MRTEPARTMACDRRYMVPVVGGGGTFVRQEVRHAWLNQDSRTLNLCGVSDFPSKNSRVVSLP